MTEMVTSSLNIIKNIFFTHIKSMMGILDGGGLFHVVIWKLVSSLSYSLTLMDDVQVCPYHLQKSLEREMV